MLRLALVKSLFRIPSSSVCKKQKEVENEEKNIDSLQKKAKAKVNIDYFSLMNGQWKVFEGQWKPCGLFKCVFQGIQIQLQWALIVGQLFWYNKKALDQMPT